ncbi:TPA: hypothetical protein ACXIJH_005057 [Serratia marcescens]
MSLSSINVSASVQSTSPQLSDTFNVTGVSSSKISSNNHEGKSADDAKNAQAGFQDAMKAAGDIFKNLTSALSEGMGFLSKIADIAKSVMGKVGG